MELLMVAAGEVRAMYDGNWNNFAAYCSWFNYGRDPIQIDGPRHALNDAFQPTDLFRRTFPELTRLLSCARVTRVILNNQHYNLFGWTRRDGQPSGWLCLPPCPEARNPELHPTHHTLLDCFGGIAEQWNTPESSWLLNHNSALREDRSEIGFKDQEWWYHYLCKAEGFRPTIRFSDHIAFAFESNGNRTAYHRKTEAIVMYAHDHYFHHIDPLPGCPEYTFYSIRGCPTLQTWVEAVAQQWMAELMPLDSSSLSEAD